MDYGDRGGVPSESETAECNGYAPRCYYRCENAAGFLLYDDTGRPDRRTVGLYLYG